MANANNIASDAINSIRAGGAALTDEQKRQQALAEQRRQDSADYLGDIEDPIARGQGGYNADESSAIQDQAGLQGLKDQYSGLSGKYGDLSKQVGGLYDPDSVSPSADFLAQQQLTPAQQQDMITSAGITAGKGAQAAKDAVGRAAAATGGNPLALGTFRARLDRQGAGEAADAMTNARVATSNAAAQRSAGAEQMREAGGANRFNQGNTIANEQAGLVGKQSDITGAQTGLENAGSQRAGSVAGTRLGSQQNALNYYQGQNQQADADTQNAQNRQQQTYQSQTGGTTAAANTGVTASQTPSTFDKILGAAGGALSFLEDGDVPNNEVDAIVGEDGPEQIVDTGADAGAAKMPFWKRMAQRASDAAKQNMGASQQGQQQPQRQWSPVDTYSTLGKAAGKVASTFLADGGLILQPTRVRLSPNEAVVPLNYRPGAKIRPSMATLPPARQRRPFGGMSA